jgi:hypothetical protein
MISVGNLKSAQLKKFLRIFKYSLMQILIIIGATEGIRFEFPNLSYFENLEKNQTGGADQSVAAFRLPTGIQTAATTVLAVAPSSHYHSHRRPPFSRTFKASVWSRGAPPFRFFHNHAACSHLYSRSRSLPATMLAIERHHHHSLSPCKPGICAVVFASTSSTASSPSRWLSPPA